MKTTALFVLVFAIGCGNKSVKKNAEPVEISGSVSMGGRPVNDVVFNLQPTGDGAQATLPVKDGAFQGTVTPGTYTYYISETRNARAFEAIPEKYRSGAMDRKVEVASGTRLTVQLD
jgi:hypothetical protein